MDLVRSLKFLDLLLWSRLRAKQFFTEAFVWNKCYNCWPFITRLGQHNFKQPINEVFGLHFS